MTRRCVICGRENPHDEFGNPQYHYPKNRREAKIWKESLQADSVSINGLQNYSCVCYNHIPDFIDQTSRITSGHCKSKGVPPYEPDPPDCRAKAQINVLLMTGASLPTYCGKSCTEEPPGPYSKLSDTDICVLESNFSDMGINFPDDQPEISVMHCNEKKKEQEKQMNKDKADYDDISDYDYYLDDDEDENCACAACTDVLVLARAKDVLCPCEETTCGDEDPGKIVCCPPGCVPQTIRRSDAPPCGCECDQAVREQLDSVIKKQALRIRELEMLLNRQADMHEQIYSKVADLHQEVKGKSEPTDIFQPTQPSPSYTEAKNKLDNTLVKNKKDEKMDRRAQSLLFDTLVQPTSDKNRKRPSKSGSQTSLGKGSKENVKNKKGDTGDKGDKGGRGSKSSIIATGNNRRGSKGSIATGNRRGSKGSIIATGNRRDSLGKVSYKEEDIIDKDPEESIETKPKQPKPEPKRKQKIPFCRKVKYLLKRKPKD